LSCDSLMTALQSASATITQTTDGFRATRVGGRITITLGSSSAATVYDCTERDVHLEGNIDLVMVPQIDDKKSRSLGTVEPVTLMARNLTLTQNSSGTPRFLSNGQGYEGGNGVMALGPD